MALSKNSFLQVFWFIGMYLEYFIMILFFNLSKYLFASVLSRCDTNSLTTNCEQEEYFNSFLAWFGLKNLDHIININV